MKIASSRQEAQLRGDNTYDTGKPCKHGHLSYRLTSNATCMKCVLIRTASWKDNNWDLHLQQCANWKKNHADDVKKSTKQYYASNSLKVKKQCKQWKTNNKAKVTQLTNKRRAQKIKATPTWADEQKIQRVYERAARLTAIKNQLYVVDHIIPLQSKIVCGLHCQQNLRVVTAKTNSRKLNSTWPDMP